MLLVLAKILSWVRYMRINKDIFREYDIRGIADYDFAGEFPFILGKAFGYYLNIHNFSGKLAVSGDVRPSTKRLKKEFINGALSVGINVIDLGILPTPANYFSNYHFSDSSVQITGSHNPSEYNGFKFTLNRKPFFGPQIKQLYEIIAKNKFDNLKYKESNLEYIDILPSYIDDMVKRINLKKNINVIMDCGNAAGAIVAPQIFKKIGLKLTELFCEVDGTFPNHHPDPTVDSNLKEIIKKIKKDKIYDLGIAFDGDADRVVCIDSEGSIIRSDILMCIFINDIISKIKNKKIIYDVKCSTAVNDIIIKNGGIPIEWSTGHSLIKNKMKVEKANFGGEFSGHIFFADDFYGYDDAIYVSLRMIEILSNTNKKLKDLVNEIPKYVSTPELRFECTSDKIKFEIMQSLKDYFMKSYNCSDIDGVKIYFDNGWGLLRASNTQPIIVCRIEAKSQNELTKIKNVIIKKLSDYKGIKVEF